MVWWTVYLDVEATVDEKLVTLDAEFVVGVISRTLEFNLPGVLREALQ
ncbi:MAG: hypothetical protein WBA57_14150 [Elainellaceae cyanobacterium]